MIIITIIINDIRNWIDFIKDVNNDLNSELPHIVHNVPILSSTNILYLLNDKNSSKKFYTSLSSCVFTSYNNDTIWSHIYNIKPSYQLSSLLLSPSSSYTYEKFPDPMNDPLFQAIAPSLVKVSS